MNCAWRRSAAARRERRLRRIAWPTLTAHCRERVTLPALHKVRDNGLARTPPMGWNSWNKFAGRVSDEIVRGMADAMASNGMSDAGYIYINIDDTWEGERDAQGVHPFQQQISGHEGAGRLCSRQGSEARHLLRPGPNTCAGYEGTHGHEQQDAQTWAGLGHRLSEIRLVRRAHDLHR